MGCTSWGSGKVRRRAAAFWSWDHARRYRDGEEAGLGHGKVAGRGIAGAGGVYTLA